MKKNGKNSNNDQRRVNLILIVTSFVLVLGVLILGLVIEIRVFQEEQNNTEQAIKEQLGAPESKSEIADETANDFPSEEAGTFSGWMQVKQDIPIEDAIVLFSSARINGLAMVYYPKDQRVVVGTPPMIVENVVLFDGNEHHLVYSFQKNGQQAFLVDEKVLKVENYSPYQQNGITGMAVGVAKVYGNSGVSENVVSDYFEEIEIE